jgi:HEAT repeat protein
MGIDLLENPREVEKYLSNKNWLIRQEAIKKLGEIGDKKTVKILIEIVKKEKNKYDLIYAISSLGKLKDKSATPVLLNQIDSKNSEIANGAIFALGEIGDKSAITKLKEKAKYSRLKVYCIDALIKLGGKI